MGLQLRQWLCTSDTLSSAHLIEDDEVFKKKKKRKRNASLCCFCVVPCQSRPNFVAHRAHRTFFNVPTAFHRVRLGGAFRSVHTVPTSHLYTGGSGRPGQRRISCRAAAFLSEAARTLTIYGDGQGPRHKPPFCFSWSRFLRHCVHQASAFERDGDAHTHPSGLMFARCSTLLSE